MSSKSLPVVVICSSANFYAQAVEVRNKLAKLNYKAIVPATAEVMEKTGDFDISHYKTWFANSKDYSKKADLMLKHFDKIAKGNAILVLNYEKHGVKNYIGGNVLMEMGLAFYLKLPIFILNEVPEQSSFLEELWGFLPIILHGNINKLPEEYEKITK